ncbi:LysR family transcriptional regulator [Flavobacterium sp. HSC-61S13]|uniref:LysR family transcriptional regulator n=1 Tax=Flavobacterium sp. HSC-61S13 TaxID=2910963 RepID=UPI0020A10788|nr:LysR family transcriptional regulator [Flavobacterium sp. HSC-61S13]MCP1997551.1 DNA-binding transcriptional LysR family regulator [Flavobacterium sp. HSC-61S13]
MGDQKLIVFKTVAETLSFSKTADQLFVSQPAISKSIRELEIEFGLQLFHRKGNKITLTSDGKSLKKQVDYILSQYQELYSQVASLKNSFPTHVKLGASTTISQYVLPKLLPRFKNRFPHIALELLNGNTQKIEKEVLKQNIELGFIEGQSQNKQLKYQFFMKDELVLIAHHSNPISDRDSLSTAEFLTSPIVLREIGSGSLQVIKHVLQEQKIKLKDLNIEMHLGSTESIKKYLEHSHCLGIVSIQAIQTELKEGTFKIIDLDNISFERNFYFITSHGNNKPYIEKLIQFILDHHNL